MENHGAGSSGEPGDVQDVQNVLERIETVVVRGHRTDIRGSVRVVHSTGADLHGGSTGDGREAGFGERGTDGIHHQLCSDGQLEGDCENDV